MSEMDEARATSDWARRNLVRMAERVYGEYFKERDYPFQLVLHEVRAFAKFCEDHGLGDVDHVEPLVTAFFSPHPSRFAPQHLAYLLSQIDSESDDYARVTAVVRFVEKKYPKKD